ncbi:multiheme c-type cytochrome [Desulfonatronum thiosulfatophilum]|nr:multiheme c-type cytochrome [Desulfonatronum thiosulfatophilum]
MTSSDYIHKSVSAMQAPAREANDALNFNPPMAGDPDSVMAAGFSIDDDLTGNSGQTTDLLPGITGEHTGRTANLDQADANSNMMIPARSNSSESRNQTEKRDKEQDLAEMNRFEAGAFEDPENCEMCHQEIFDAWSQSKHRYAWENIFYQPDYIQASRESEGFTDIFCGECHAPIGVRTGQLPPPDGSQMDETSRKGVSCDYCHTVKKVVRPFNVQTISDPGDVKRGPKGDGWASYHEIEFSKIHTDPAFCGACHNVVHPTSGAPVIDTYDDWKAGPYAQEGIRCQDCHMTPGPGVEKNPGRSSFMGEDRDHVATHFFQGGSVFFHEKMGNQQEAALSRQMLEAAAELETEVFRTNNGVEIIARVKNVGAGHKIPTGVTYIRKMWLEVTAKNGSGEEIFRSGHVTESNRIDPGAKFYRKIFKDAEGNLTPKSWVAEEIGYDHRIPAKGHDEQLFRVPAVHDDDEIHVLIRLMYRSMSQEVAEGLGIEGIEVPALEMTRAELTIP